MCNLGGAYTSLGQHENAIEHLTQALAIDRELDDQRGVGEDLNNLGTACLALGQYENAIEHLTQSLAISRTLGDQGGLGTDLGNLGNAHLQLGQYELAIKHYNLALEFDRVSNDRYGLGQRLGNLGNAYTSLGQYERAIELYTQSLAISKEMGDQRGVGIELGHLGNAYLHLGQRLPSPEGNAYLQQAIEHYTQALAIDRKAGNRQGEGGGLGNLGNAYRALGQYKEAAEHYTHALEISRAIGDRRGEGTDLNNLGLLYLNDLKDPAAALPWLQQSRATFDALWDEITEDERRVSFGDIFSGVGRALQLAHAQLGQHMAALEEAERARSRAFELLLSQQRLAAKVGIAKADAGSTEIDASSQAGAQPLRLDELLAVAEKQHVTIIVFSQITSSQLLAWVLRGGDTPLTMEHIYILPEDKSLAQLIELTRRTIGARARQGEASVPSSGPELLVDPPSALAPPTVDEVALEEAMSRTSLVAEGNEGGASQTDTKDPPAANDLAALLSRCHELLIKPLGLVDGEPLLIIPDRDLYALPFAAMVDSEGKYLIERHSLRVSPSVGTVIELQRRAASRPPPSRPSAMVVGDPSFGGGSGSSAQWAKPLPGARLEARRIKALLDDTDAYEGAVEKRVGDEAGKMAVVEAMRGCDVIHLATHGEPGAVLLGGATRAEGALSMAEVQRLELQARLVVLSECDSFRGKLTSDGVIGVTRAFVAAGALTLVASLWKVDDDATFALMSHFYTALLSSGGLGDAASALRSAMVAMIHDKKNQWSMLQWAGFVVYGLASASDGGGGEGGGGDGRGCSERSSDGTRTRSSEVQVQYAVTGPVSVAPEATVFSLKVWAMIEAQVDRFKKELKSLREQGAQQHEHQFDDLDVAVSQLRVRVSVVGCTVEPSERTVQWNRKIVSSSHSVLVPANFSDNLSCTVIISDDSPAAMRDRDLFERTFVIERGSAGVPLKLGVLAATVARLEQQLQDVKAQLGLHDPVLVNKVKRASVRIGIYKTATKKLISLGSGTLIDAGPGAPVGQVLSAAHLFVRADNPALPPYVDPAIDWKSMNAPFLILVGMYQADDQPSCWAFWAELMTPLSVLQTTNPLPWSKTLVDLAVLCIRGKIEMSPKVFTGPGLSETFEVVNRSNAATPLSLPDGIQLGEPLAVQTGISMVTVFGWFAPNEEDSLYMTQSEKIISNAHGLLISQALLHTAGSGGAQVDPQGRLLAVNSRSSDPAIPMPREYKAYGRMISDLLPTHGLET